MDGEEAGDKSVRAYDDEQILDLQSAVVDIVGKILTPGLLIGLLILIVMGIALQALSHTLGGSNVRDFFAGLLLGLSVVEMLAGIWVIAKGARGK